MPGRTKRGIGVLSAVGLLSAACCGPAAAAGINSTLLVSRPSGLGALPASGDGSSFVGPNAISGDGRLIVFVSGADDLGVADREQHVWLRDTVAETTTLVDRVPGGSEPGDGFADAAAISRDGSTVCFVGSATNLVAGVTGTHVFTVTLANGAIVVADRAAGATGAIGDNSADRCALDGVGTQVVFDSDATNLVAGDTNGTRDVFVRDLAGSSTTRVSVTSTGLQVPNGGRGGAISANGLHVAFDASDPLIGGDTNGVEDVYVRNLQTDGVVRASVRTGGEAGNDRSFGASIDDSGGHVAFVSAATNLDLGADNNGRRDVFWRDLTGSDTTVLVSRATGAGGALGDQNSGRAVISGDGLGVAFESAATNLGADTPPANSLVYLRRLGTNVTSLLSRASGAGGAQADAFAVVPSVGATPTVAAWLSNASNLDPDASGEFLQVFKRDLSGEPTTTLVSRQGIDGPRSAAVNFSFVTTRGVSADGRLVVFQSRADGLDPAAAGRPTQIFVRDMVTNLTTLVSRGPEASGTSANGECLLPAINASGSHVAFIGLATNLLATEGPTTVQVYLRDLATGEVALASRADGPDGAPGDAVEFDVPDVSADGTRVVFVANDPLVSEDDNGEPDVYVRDLATGTTILVSVGADGAVGEDDSDSPSISDDGTRVAFSSRATNLLAEPIVASDTHVYVRDLPSGTTVLVDRHAADGAPGTGAALFPEISGDGNRVVFRADQPLTSEVPSGRALYVRDLVAGTTVIAGRGDGPTGVVVNPIGSEFSISRDGTRVSFVGSGPALPGAPDVPQTYVRDLAAGTTTLASAVDGTAATFGNRAAEGGAISGAGGCVAFSSDADDLVTAGYATADFSHVYLRAVTGDCLATTSTTSTTLPPGAGSAIPATVVVVRPGKLAKLVAKGLSSLAALGDPTVGGATFQVSGTAGSTSYALPASGWKAVGRREPRGFKFKGAGCRATLLRRRIKAVCRGDTGDLRLPEPGPVEFVLTVAAERAFCAECGGTAAGKPARVFKRKRCAAPATCP